MRRAALLLLLLPTLALGQVAATTSTSAINADLSLNSSLATQAALNLYVDPTGNDSNACTSTGTGACLTLQAAVNKVPGRVRHPVVITLAAGNYAGAYLTGFSFNPVTGAAGAYIQIAGPFDNVTPATGTATGTATGGTAGSTSTFGTLTDSGATWTSNDFRGKFVVITGGTGSGQKKAIVSNTGTAITIAGTWTAPVAASSTYAIQEPTAVITSAALTPALVNAAAAAGGAININATESRIKGATSNAGTFDLLQLALVPGTGHGVFLDGGPDVHIQRCRIVTSGTVNGINLSTGTPSVKAEEITVINAVNGGGVVQINFSSPSQVAVVNSLLRGGGNGSGVSTTGAGNRWNISSCQIENYGFQVNLAGSAGLFTLTNCRLDGASIASGAGIGSSASSASGAAPFGFTATAVDISNCVTAVKLDGPGKYGFLIGVVSGSGNTTAINAAKGARVQFSSTATLTGTTEITVDAVNETIANMRAATPKTFPTTANIYGSLVYE